MKKRPIEKTANVIWNGSQYAVPARVMEKYKISKNMSIDEVFGDIVKETGEPAVLLQGLRYREGLSQVKFAKLIGITQANLSAMENGKRSIGKIIAKRIAEKFDVNYRMFL